MVDSRTDALSWLRKQLAEERPDIARGATRRRLRPGGRVGTVLAETHDQWADTRRYMTVDALLRHNPVTDSQELSLEQAASRTDEDDDRSQRPLGHHLDGCGRLLCPIPMMLM